MGSITEAAPVADQGVKDILSSASKYASMAKPKLKPRVDVVSVAGGESMGRRSVAPQRTSYLSQPSGPQPSSWQDSHLANSEMKEVFITGESLSLSDLDASCLSTGEEEEEVEELLILS